MSHHVAGALGSKWGNPFKPKKSNKNSLKKCLERYEDYIRKNPDLFNAVMELEGKEIGCWCKPSPCHGDILIKLFKERQCTNPCSIKSNNQKYIPVLTECGSNDDDIDSDITGISECVVDCDDVGGNGFLSVNDSSAQKCREVLNKEHYENGLSVNSTSRSVMPLENRENNCVPNCSPLRLNGGGNTSFESQEEINLADEGDNPLDVSISDSNCSNDVLTFVNQDNSICLRQVIRLMP